MELKGLTCYHMIVITKGEGEAAKQRGNNKTEAENRIIPLFFFFFFFFKKLRVLDKAQI